MHYYETFGAERLYNQSCGIRKNRYIKGNTPDLPSILEEVGNLIFSQMLAYASEVGYSR